jgi:hypothetical protein
MLNVTPLGIGAAALLTTLRADALTIEAGAFDALTAPYVSQGFQGAVGLRTSKSLSMGAIGSFTSLSSGKVLGGVGSGPGGGVAFQENVALSLWRTSAEARWHFFETRFFGAWVGAEAGIAGLRSRDTTSVQVTGGSSSTTVTEVHLAPLAGFGTGARFFPVPFLSIGIEGRAQLIAFDSSPLREALQGPTASLLATLNMGFHVPLEVGASGYPGDHALRPAD